MTRCGVAYFCRINKRIRVGNGRTALTVLLFVGYLVLLVWTVLWKLHVPFVGRDDMREIKLLPFAQGDGYGASAPLEVVANLLIFVPFGVYLSALLPRWPAWKITITIAGASAALEVTQFALAVGSSDVTDVIVNFFGGLVGMALLALVRRTMQRRAPAVLVTLGVAATVIAAIAVGLYVASFPSIPPPGSGTGVIIR